MPNTFPPDTGERISVLEAKEMIKKYDDEHRLDKNKDTSSVFFGKDSLLQLIVNNPEASGVRFYLAKAQTTDGVGEVTLVLVPLKEDGTEIWDAKNMAAASEGPLNRGLHCPPVCN